MTLPNRCTHQLLAPNLCVKFSTSLPSALCSSQDHTCDDIQWKSTSPLMWCTLFSRFNCCTLLYLQLDWFLVSWSNFASYPQGFFRLERNGWRVPRIEPQRCSTETWRVASLSQWCLSCERLWSLRAPARCALDDRDGELRGWSLTSCVSVWR